MTAVLPPAERLTPQDLARPRLIEPVKIDLVDAAAKLLDALEYYKTAFGLGNDRLAAIVLIAVASQPASDQAVNKAFAELFVAFQDRLDMDTIAGKFDRGRLRLWLRLVAAGAGIRLTHDPKQVALEWKRGQRVASRGPVDPAKIGQYIIDGDYDKAYRAGASLRYIGNRIGYRHTEVGQWLVQAGVRLRPPNGGRRHDGRQGQGRQRPTPPIQPIFNYRARRAVIDQLIADGKWAEAYEAGASINDVASATGYAYSSMRKWLIKAGVVLRKPGGDRM